MQTLITQLKVNNEIELCEIEDPEFKTLVEKELLANRVSYYIRWPRTSIFSRHRDLCIICVNENSVELAEDVVSRLCQETGYEVNFLFRKSQANFL